MKLRLVFSFVFLICLGAVSRSQEVQKVLPSTPGAWYDVDGDGRLDFFRNGGEFFKLRTDNTPYKVQKSSYIGNKPQLCRMGNGSPLVLLGWGNKDAFIVQPTGTLSEIDLPKRISPHSESQYSYYFADVNNDGAKRLIRMAPSSKEFDLTYSVEADGTFSTDKVHIMSWNEYNNLRSELTLTSGGDGIPGMGDMFGYDHSGTSYGDFRMLDLNGDGMTDMFDGASGKYFLNTGLNSFVSNQFGGGITPRDINNDGIVDFIIYDIDELTYKLIKSNGAENTDEVVLLSGVYCNYSDRIWCYDFDKDGDVDILIPIDTKKDHHNNGAAFLVYFENDGNGNFTRYENWLDGILSFHDCLDFDNDGNYEIVALNELGSNTRADVYSSGLFDLRFYEITGPEIQDKPDIFYQSTNRATYRDIVAIPINLDNSGKISLSVGKSYIDESEIVYTSKSKGNRPSAPGKPEFMYNEQSGLLKLFWKEATDAETSSADLTYEIRVGTSSDTDDIIPVNALPDGRRRTLSQGANGHQLYHTYDISSWPAGTYYLSVQAVDPNMMGSKFSECAIFEKKTSNVKFSIDAPKNLSVGDEISISLDSSIGPEDIVTWNLADGELLSQNHGGKECLITFNTPGEKRISVNVANPSGVSSDSRERYLKIIPARTDSIYNGDPLYGIQATFDLDADGSDEYIPLSMLKIMEQDESGEISIVKKMYNTNIPGFKWNNGQSYFIPTDINRDGLVDIIQHQGAYYDAYRTWTNNGNKDLSISDEFSIYKPNQYADIYYEDFDNDGSLEGILSNCTKYFKLSDDCQTFETISMNFSESLKIQSVYDFDGDGLLDLYVLIQTDPWNWVSAIPAIYYNKGNMTFQQGEQLPMLNDALQPILVGDFDSDGKPDLVYNEAGGGFGVSWYDATLDIHYGNGHKVKVLCPDGNPFDTGINTFDYDNNGFQDFIVSLSNQKYAIIYLFPDYSYQIAVMENGWFPAIVKNAVFNRNNGITCTNNLKISNINNTPPTAPKSIRHSVNDKFVNIAWDPASDNETPSNGLRYNISVKHKGVSGNGAYLISPMNLERDYVSTPHNHTLLVQPRINIPVASIPPGEYEVRVQAVDNRHVSGPYSEIYSLTVPERPIIDIPASVIVDRPTTVSLIGKQTQPSIDFGTDAEYEYNGKNYEVIWHSEGLKNIIVNGAQEATIMVYNAPDADFSLPTEVLEGSTINISCASAKKGNWYIVEGEEPVLLDNASRVQKVAISDGNLSFIISGENNFILRHTVSEYYGENTVEHECMVNSLNAKPEIDFVGVDSDSKHNEIHWNPSLLPLNSETVNVYRETSRVNEFELIGKVLAENGNFTDLTSNSNIKADRYVITVDLPYGESAKSNIHQTPLLQLNHLPDNSVNLRWNKYEGHPVVSYQINAGEDPSSLQPIGEVDGNVLSYIDNSPHKYYSISVFCEKSSQSSKEMNKTIGVGLPMSNVASRDEASNALIARHLDLYIPNNADILDLDKSRTLKISALLRPAGVSINRLNWEVTEGKDIATINDNGLVTVSQKGEICVKAYTIDGSELESSIRFTAIGGDILIENITISPEDLTGFVDETFTLKAEIFPDNATNKELVWRIDNPQVASFIDDSRIKLRKVGTATITAEATDGSGVSASCKVTVLPILIESIQLTPDSWSGEKGKSFTIYATVFPENAVNKTLTWSSSDESIARVSSNGKVTTYKIGEAVITAKATDGSGVSASCKVTALPILVESIKLTPESWNGVEGDSFSIVAAVYPPKATNTNVVWSSSDEDIASVDTQGLVSVHKEGSCVITATAEDGSGVSAECIITSVAGIEEIFSDTALLDIYDMNGLLIGKDCDKEHLKSLTPGIYLIRFGSAMKKLVVR